MEEFYLGAYWKNDYSTADEYLSKSFNFIQEIIPLFFNYDKISIIDKNGKMLPFPDSIDEYKKISLPLVYNNDAWYFQPDGIRDKVITPNSICDMGFYKEYFFENDADAISVSINGGKHVTKSPEGIEYGSDVPNSLVISFPSDKSNEFSDYEFVKNLLIKVIEHWNPQQSIVTSHEFSNRLEPDDITYFYIGWLNYFKDPKVMLVLPSDIEKEKIDGGVLFSLSKEIHNSEDTNLVNKAMQIRETFIKEQLFNL